MTELDRTIDDLTDRLSPVRPVNPLAARWLVAAVAAATLCLAVLAWGRGQPAEAFASSQVSILSAGLFFLLGVAGGWALTCMGRPALGKQSNGWRWAAGAVGLLPIAAVLLSAAGAAPWVGTSGEEGIDCLARGLLASLASALTLTWWLRRGAPLRINTAAWLVGVTSGAVGALAVALTCPDQALSHIGLWHVAIVAAAAMLGRLATPAFLRW